MDREMQNQMAEGAQERREAIVREWLADAEFKAALRRSREEILRKYRATHRHLVAAE